MGQLTAATFTPEGGEPQVLSLAYDKAGQLTGEQGINGGTSPSATAPPSRYHPQVDEIYRLHPWEARVYQF